ncbi:hypothetical protein BKA70DRAFT_1397638 [Coprinopsis sp. MPI-PUGE-AT-0042]|nr:hypothetical protein BKA70DRAFT_1397638 [Coprinopsis sp. MPI-PUGE-AT-0042]
MPPKDQHAAGTPVPMNPPSTAGTPVPMTMASGQIVAGTPVQTYPSPAHATAHAQWAASAQQQQQQIDPSLQQQQASTSSAAPAVATTATAQRTAQHVPVQAATTQATTQNLTSQNLQAYYQNYAQHYPYYAQYITQALNQAQAQQQQQQQQSAVAAQSHTSSPVVTSQAPRTATYSTTPAASAAPTPVVPAYAPAVANIQTAPSTSTMPAPAAPAAPSNNNLDTNDISTLNDALGSAGVDLRHKVVRVPEEAINYMALALRARLQDLVTSMIKAAKYRKEAQFDRPASFYETLQNGNAMDVDGGGGGVKQETPMWSIVVRSDVAKQLALIERIERDEEMRIRRERKERQEMTAAHNAALAAQAAGASNGMDTSGGYPSMNDDPDGPIGGGSSGSGQPKKKKKKEGPGVTARNMSEDVRKKMSNAVATQAAGLGKYAWMNAAAANTGGGAAAASSAASPAATSTPAKATKAAAGGAGTAAASAAAEKAANTWVRPYKKPTLPTPATTTTPEAQQKTDGEDPNKVTLTLRDAMFVVEKERGHGGGRGSARGWT